MMEINSSDRVRFGPYEVDLHTRELWKHGVKVKLVGQPFEILSTLVTRPGQLVTREQLRDQLWPGDTFVDFDHGLNAAVNKLRDALCDSAEDPRYIETLPRRGYRFVAVTENIRPGPAAVAPISETAAVGPLEVELAQPAAPGPRPDISAVSVIDVASPIPEVAVGGSRRRRWRLYLAFAIILLTATMVVRELSFYFKTQAEKNSGNTNRVRNFTPLTSLADPASDPSFAPDGSRVAFRRESFVPGMAGIYVKKVGGEVLVQLTNNAGDCCPVWSPEGKSIAFSRITDEARTIYEVAAAGGEPRRLFLDKVAQKRGELDWSPDGKSIALVGEDSQGRSSIYLLTLQNSAVRPITMPAAGEQDRAPVFSPEGDRIAFVRSSVSGVSENIMVMPAGGGETRLVTVRPTLLLGSPSWSSDGESLIYASEEEGSAGLFRVPAAGGAAIPIREVDAPVRELGGRLSHPTVSKRGFRLAFEQTGSARNIQQLDLSPPGQSARGLITTVTGENEGPQFSPDGRKIAFISDRSGGRDIWISDRDGQNPVQLTSIGTAGTPRWSADGTSVAFDVGLASDWQQPRAVFVVKSDGGAPHAVVQDSFNNPAPSWSRDGGWLYFPSDRSGTWQVWKVPATGGAPVQVTTQGGFAAWEAADGNVYYAKHRNPGPEIWKIPASGGPEAPVYPALRPVDWAAWAVIEKGILFVETGRNNVPTLSLFDFGTLRVSHLAVLQETPFWLAATPDGGSIAFDQPGTQERHIMILENFR